MCCGGNSSSGKCYMTLLTNTDLFSRISQHLQTVQEFVNTKVNSVNNSAQQVTESLQEKASQVTINWEQAKGSLAQSWQAAEQFQNTTSTVIQTSITSVINDWLAQYPILTQLLQIFTWGTNHPIISLVILLLVIALVGSVIKAIVRLIETASWSILKVPLKLLQTLLKISFVYLTKLVNYVFEKIRDSQTSEPISTTIPVMKTIIYEDKQQRLAEISRRLDAIHLEQQALLKEAGEIIAAEGSEIKIPGLKITS
jgi:hypothetical protein